MNLREKINNETLTLRKIRHKHDLFSRRSIYINDRERNQICPLKLKGIPEKILEKFRINILDLENTIKGTMNYLNSKELNEIKFGCFIIRRFFMELVQIDSELNSKKEKLDFKIDLFLENGLIESIGKVLTVESNIEIISELTWALVNITYFDSEKDGSAYIKRFMNKTYMDIFYKLLKYGDNEILSNMYQFLLNCIIENDDFAKFIFSDENFIRLCIMKYLEQTKPAKNEQEAKRSAIIFFVSLSKLGNILNEKQKITFYKIYEKFLGVQFDSEILLYVIFGIRFLFTLDTSKEKILFNIIKKNNYEIFDKLFLTFNNMYKTDQSFQDDLATFNIAKIVTHFIKLSDESDIIFLLQNTQLINFIDYFFQKIYFKGSKNILLDIIIILSHHTSNVVLNMIKDKEDFVKTIKEYMNYHDFDIKIKCVEIVYSMLSLLSIDINLILYRNEIIEDLIKVNLPFEEEKTCLKYILSSILYFINSIKPLEKEWKIEIINNLIKFGIINGLENMPTRFNEEHILIINQINSEIKNIINNVGDSTEEKNVNYIKNNPFIKFNKNEDEKNNLTENNSNGNNQKAGNPFF